MESDPVLLDLYRRNAEALGRTFPPDDEQARPTLSTDMANMSLALPTIHPLVGIDAGGSVNHQPEFAAACVGPSAEQAVLRRRPVHGLDGDRRRSVGGCAPAPAGRLTADGRCGLAGRVELPEDVTQDIGHLAEGGHGGQGDFIGHQQVLGPSGRRLHIGQGGVHRRLVPLGSRTRLTLATWDRWSSGSMGNTSVGSSSSSTNLLTPTMIFSPSSMALA